jgi:hypothetical protein
LAVALSRAAPEHGETFQAGLDRLLGDLEAADRDSFVAASAACATVGVLASRQIVSSRRSGAVAERAH